MALTIPNYVTKAGVAGSATKFKWDDPWECRFEVPRLDNQISPFYSRTVLAIATATAEWVVWSLPSREDVVPKFIEACWVAVVDRRYLNHVSRTYEDSIREDVNISSRARRVEDMWTPEDLRDPLRGPQFVAICNLGEVADRTAPGDNGSIETVFSRTLSNRS